MNVGSLGTLAGSAQGGADKSFRRVQGAMSGLGSDQASGAARLSSSFGHLHHCRNIRRARKRCRIHSGLLICVMSQPIVILKTRIHVFHSPQHGGSCSGLVADSSFESVRF